MSQYAIHLEEDDPDSHIKELRRQMDQISLPEDPTSKMDTVSFAEAVKDGF